MGRHDLDSVFIKGILDVGVQGGQSELLRTLHNSFSPLLSYPFNRPDDGRSRHPQMKIGDRLIPRTMIGCRAPGISSLACLGMK
jgi:hypothetical protein